jgi:hypothetical protein
MLDDDEMQIMTTAGWILVGYLLGIVVCGIISRWG